MDVYTPCGVCCLIVLDERGSHRDRQFITLVSDDNALLSRYHYEVLPRCYTPRKAVALVSLEQWEHFTSKACCGVAAPLLPVSLRRTSPPFTRSHAVARWYNRGFERQQYALDAPGYACPGTAGRPGTRVRAPELLAYRRARLRPTPARPWALCHRRRNRPLVAAVRRFSGCDSDRERCGNCDHGAPRCDNHVAWWPRFAAEAGGKRGRIPANRQLCA